MTTVRQPLLTLSPSQHFTISPSETAEPLKSPDRTPQTTPTLPRRERLASFSRLLKKKNFSALTSNAKEQENEEFVQSSRAADRPSVGIRVSPCSPRLKSSPPLQADEDIVKFLSLNHLPFSPKMWNKRSPVTTSPNYRHPSPLRSPLYQPNNSRNFLGRGSFGKVSLLKYKGENVAVKTINHSSSYIGEKNLLGIRHPHLVEIFYISSVLDKALIFMEFAGHCNLQQILDTKSELDLRRRLSFCSQIASGLRHCHQNRIAHGDVKPANVMVSPLGICKLGDFGHSIRLDIHPANKLTRTAEDVVGTVAYAAPEVLRGSSPTQSSDIYSFGILLWQVETRELPFAGEHPHVIIYKVANYGNRPKFQKNADPIMSLYIQTAESCWRTVPQERIDANEALYSIQDIMQKIKESNIN